MVEAGVSIANAGDERTDVSRAMKVAAVLAAKRTDEFVKPGRLVEVRFVKGNSLSLTASRLLALMILTAGGDAWRDMSHRIRKADIRRGHKGNERIVDMLEELHRTLFAEDDLSWRGKRATRRFSLIQTSIEEVEEEGVEAGWVEWVFTPDARRLIQESETYAVLNRQAVLGFRSSYALKLYELGALRLHRRQPVWRTDIAGLRAALGILPDTYKDFAQLRRKVLLTAKSEIDQLAHFCVEWRETKAGRTIAELEFRFQAKGAPAQIDTVDELERHSSGRRPRRERTLESIVTDPGVPAPAVRVAALPSPASTRPASPEPISDRTPIRFAVFPRGSLQYSADEFRAVGRKHGGGWDVDLIAQAYRDHMGERLGRLSGGKLERSWQGFCESYVNRKGRPS